MKVSELIEKLKELPQDQEVILSNDAACIDGNFVPITEVVAEIVDWDEDTIFEINDDTDVDEIVDPTPVVILK